MSEDVIELIMDDHREVERLFDALKERPEQRVLVLPQVSSLLIAHSRAEESEVYPVARDEAGEPDEVAHSQEEHAQAEALLERLQRLDPEGAEFEESLSELVDAVGHHVREEETSVLPRIRSGLSADRLSQFGRAFAASRQQHLGDLPGQATSAEAYQEAQNADVPGRSTMAKDQLQERMENQ
jgi:hemerythrin superfamily protein